MVRTGSPAPLWGAAGKAGYVLSCVAAVARAGHKRLLLLRRQGRQQHRRFARDRQRPVHRRAEHPADGPGEPHRLERQHPAERRPARPCTRATRRRSRPGCGGNDTNTLILIHIPAGGKKAVGFSIPRDDWVTFRRHARAPAGRQDRPGLRRVPGRRGKPAPAADLAMSQHQLAFEGNEAGRAAAVATVEQLTGVHIDHFAEINLDGFYELAKVLGGVEVCLNHPVPYDPNSGFSAAHAGYQHLNAKKALAFVRQRDGLTNGDLDRTHRQQAFLDSVIAAAAHRGRARRPDQDPGPALGGQAVRHHRLGLEPARLRRPDAQPDQRQPDLPDAADRGLRDHRRPGRQRGQPHLHPAARAGDVLPGAEPLRLGLGEPSATSTAANSQVTVDVYNGGNTPGLAGQVSAALVKDGYTAGQGRQHQPADHHRGALRDGRRRRAPARSRRCST